MSETPVPAPVAGLMRARLESSEAAPWRIPAFVLFVVACSQVAVALRAFVHNWLVHYWRHDAYRTDNFEVWEAIGGEIRMAAWLHLGIALLALGVVVWILSRKRVSVPVVLVVLLLPLVAAAAVLYFQVPTDPSAARDPRFVGSLRRFALSPTTLIVHGAAFVIFVVQHRRRRRGPDLEAHLDAF